MIDYHRLYKKKKKQGKNLWKYLMLVLKRNAVLEQEALGHEARISEKNRALDRLDEMLREKDQEIYDLNNRIEELENGEEN